jgi:hypothetical protein
VFPQGAEQFILDPFNTETDIKQAVK